MFSLVLCLLTLMQAAKQLVKVSSGQIIGSCVLGDALY